MYMVIQIHPYTLNFLSKIFKALHTSVGEKVYTDSNVATTIYVLLMIETDDEQGQIIFQINMAAFHIVVINLIP
jgi:hypothetical protein